MIFFTGPCDCCNQTTAVCLHHQNTMYQDPLSNWKALCAECKEENDEYWDDMWADHGGML